MRKCVIFCDFDGTVTYSDNIIAAMKQYGPPGWEQVRDDILAQRIAIQEGVSQLFAQIPSSMKEDITNYIIEHAVIREGFSSFVDFTNKMNIPLYIVSGGIDFFVYPLLASLIPAERIYCNGSDFSGETIRILWPHACDEHCTNRCGCCKPSLLRRLSSKEDYTIAIGDSITDLQVAQAADLVIARDFLLTKCEELGLNYQPFSDFNDVTRIVEAALEVEV